MSELPARNIYIECTRVYFDRRNNGISRLTRNLIKHSDVVQKQGFGKVYPIVFYENQHYVLPMEGLFDGDPPRTFKDVKKTFHWHRAKFLARFSPGRKQRHRHRSYLEGCQTRVARTAEEFLPASARLLSPSNVVKNDILILPEILDAAQFNRLLLFKKKVPLVCLLHDLIPISHPEYFPSAGPSHRHFKFLAQNADMVVAISQYSATCYQAYENFLKTCDVPVSAKTIAYFHLGCDLDLLDPAKKPGDEITAAYQGDSATFLVCGTIEPRKNHLFILEAFDRLWKQGHRIKLIFIGGYGWNSETTEKIVQEHPEWKKSLFWFPNCSDVDLNYAYQKSDALIFASHVEGYGLPLVEALAARKQVIVSRLKVFFEIVAPEFLVNSFDPTSVDDLVATILRFLKKEKLPKVENFVPISWRERATHFYGLLNLISRES